MFNVQVLRLRDLIKYFITTITLLFLIFLGSKVKEIKLEKIFKIDVSKCLAYTVPIIGVLNGNVEEKIEIKERSMLTNVLQSQVLAMKVYETELKDNNIDEKDTVSKDTKDNKEGTLEVKTGLKTEVITKDPLKESYNLTYGNVKIKNETDIEINDDMLKPDIEIDNKNILIFHTHTCESYTSSEKYSYIPTGNFRTTDLNYSVARVGNELEMYLKKFNFNVIHNTSYHDFPAYNGSYTRSLATVQNILKDNPTDIIIDLHRDAIGAKSDYEPIVKIGDEDVAAQIMFVIGTNNGGLYHPNWNQNLKFAVKVQEKAEELYPGLFKPIILTNSRYNQHTGKFANIIEVGATGNTLDECLVSMKYLSKVIDEVLK